MFYPHPGTWPAGTVLTSAVVLLLISAAALWLRRSRPYVGVGWFWFVGMLLPVIGLVQVGSQSMADRYTYLPSIGLFILVVWSLSQQALPHSAKAKIVAVLGVLGLVGLLFSSTRQLRTWRNSETLFRHAIQANPNNALAWDHLGVELAVRGRLPEAISCFRDAIASNPNYLNAHGNLKESPNDAK